MPVGNVKSTWSVRETKGRFSKWSAGVPRGAGESPLDLHQHFQVRLGRAVG